MNKYIKERTGGQDAEGGDAAVMSLQPPQTKAAGGRRTAAGWLGRQMLGGCPAPFRGSSS